MPVNETEETTTTSKKTTSTSRSSSARTTRTTKVARTRSTATSTTPSTPSVSKTTSKPVAKKAAAPKKTSKTWAQKVEDKAKKIDNLLSRTRMFGAQRLRADVINEIKKRVSDKGPSGIRRMHFLGTIRQRKELSAMLERILEG